MNKIKFLCIDDQQDTSIEDLLKLLSTGNAKLEVERITPVELGQQIDKIIAHANQIENFGLLLDLRLDMEATSEGLKVPYRGPTLAQELRTRMAEGTTRAFPIVLWSINSKFSTSYFTDDTSHDLFDAVYGKDIEITQSPEMVALQMCDLVEGYKLITSNEQFNENLLRLSTDEFSGINAAFLDYFKIITERRTKHEVALHLMNDLIKPSGLLIDELLLASRLGIDVTASEKQWLSLKEILVEFKYDGPFGAGWPRWWWFRVEEWWNKLPKNPGNLRRIDAEERVTFLNNFCNLDLIPAQPIASGYSTKFFALCAAMMCPLDPADALRVAMPSSRTWHDTIFVSTHAALNRINRDKWRLDPLDADRLNSLKSN